MRRRAQLAQLGNQDVELGRWIDLAGEVAGAAPTCQPVAVEDLVFSSTTTWFSVGRVASAFARYG